MRILRKLKEKYGFFIIEDACHALGGRYEDVAIGSCEYSDMSVFSFHPVKHITTGEGGAITTNNRILYEKLLTYRTHGIHKNPDLFVNRKLAFDNNNEANVWYYEMPDFGYNYRITDLQCALGKNQLSKIDKFVNRRREIANTYTTEFKKIPSIGTPQERSGIEHAFHLYTLTLSFTEIGKSRNEVIRRLRELNVGTQVLYIPVHLQPYYSKKYGYKVGDYPVAENYYDRCLSIPMFPSMTDEEVEHVIDSVLSVVN